ncbi:MAG: DegV family protein [Lachnospiraceae bacterium]|nr:DegV family protein [Lachnospiraceae bacterium]
MNDFVIFTDSGCDTSQDVLDKWGIIKKDLTFRFNDGVEYHDSEMSSSEFYQRMKDGDVAKTSAVNSETFKEAFKEEIEKGNDVLFVAFSSGISATYNSGRIAIDELKEEYPDRKLYAVDSLCASVGAGLILYLISEKKKAGATIDEVYEYIIKNRMKIDTWFTVESLEYLKRGGRLSATSAFVGTILNIKPVLRVDREGKLENTAKVRGRKASLKALADKYTELAENPNEGPVFIGQGACMEDAETLAAMIKEEHGVDVMLISDVGPVIGAHTGPGIMVLSFICKDR